MGSAFDLTWTAELLPYKILQHALPVLWHWLLVAWCASARLQQLVCCPFAEVALVMHVPLRTCKYVETLQDILAEGT